MVRFVWLYLSSFSEIKNHLIELQWLKPSRLTLKGMKDVDKGHKFISLWLLGATLFK